MNQKHEQHISHDFGQKQVLVCWVCLFSSRWHMSLQILLPDPQKSSSGFSHQPDQKNLVRRGEEATLNLFLHNWPCVWSLGWKTLCLSKSNQNSVFNLGGSFPTDVIVLCLYCEAQYPNPTCAFEMPLRHETQSRRPHTH